MINKMIIMIKQIQEKDILLIVLAKIAELVLKKAIILEVEEADNYFLKIKFKNKVFFSIS
jgi:hypothetical protein